MKNPRLRLHPRPYGLALAALLAAGAAGPAGAQSYPVTPQQRAIARQTAQQGVPLSELAPNAPDEYTVRRGDTLWAISRLYLRSPWRWPELWGMNLADIANPHRIYPGQVLYLDKADGRARLSLHRGGAGDGTVKLSPRTRYEGASDLSLPTLNPSLIEAFLTEPEVVDDESVLSRAPHIVAGNDNRVLLSRGDRAYARGEPGAPLVLPPGPSQQLRVFRNATPLKDPGTGEILGYEGQYLGKVRLERGESTETQMENGKQVTAIVPATVDVLSAREEIRAGDRLLPEPPRQLVSYVPRAPAQPVEGGRIVSIYGNAVSFAGQNQVVAINKGRNDGMESGLVLAILKNGETIVDKTGSNAKETLKLPNERIGLLMVFRTFSRVSYALVLEITDTPRAGDLLANP
ncbi:MAG: LysM domain-containing protein [Xenophilus sp.]